MGKKIIAGKIRGMALWAKVSLITALALLFCVFMYQGWYKPQKIDASTYSPTTAGTYSWTCPAGVTSVTVEVWGGGGGGGGASTVTASGGGGGGGGYSKGTVSVTPGTVYTNAVVVGAAGTGGTSAGTNGNPGGQSSFTGDAGATVTANGGLGGTGKTTAGGGAGGAGGAGSTYTGGAGYTGVTSTGGGGGGSAGTASNGTTPTGSTGAVAVTGGGPGGNGGANAVGSAPATGPGGGGGGGGRSNGGGKAGGTGFDGKIVLTYYAQPVISVATTDSPDPVTAGSTVTFTATATDADTPADSWYMAVCKTNAVTPGTAGAAPTCPGGAYGISGSAVASGSPNTATWTASGSGAQNWYAFACDNNATTTLCSAVDTANSPITVNAADTTPPTVSSTTPTNGATGVTVNTSLQVVFNENIDCATSASGNITMSGATVGAPSCSGPTTTITYPVSGQSGSTTYNYTIGGVKDVAGNTMATTASRSYTTAAVVVNNTTVGAMSFPTVDSSSIAVQSAYTGDADNNNSCTIAWGTDGSTYPNSLTTTKGAGFYAATASGLSASTTYYFRATYTDATGLSGSPSTGSQATSAAAVGGGAVSGMKMHNYTTAKRSGSTNNYWSTKNGWGVPGGVYGKFDCATCHRPDATNIKAIQSKMTSGGNGGFPGKTTVFLNPTSAGAMTEAGRASSFRVCEVCHTQTQHHRYSVGTNYTNWNGGGGGGTSTQTDTSAHYYGSTSPCVGCHSHDTGFMAGCTACHGNPPTTLGELVTNPQATLALGNPPTNAGSHATHVTSEGMTCAVCHSGNTMPTVSKTIQMGFDINNSSWPGFAGTAAFGSFSGRSPLGGTPAYTFVSSKSGTLVNTSASYRTSCNVYCHGQWIGASGSINPSWIITDGSQSACGTCHGASAANPPATGKHTTHASSSAGNYGFSCTKCHPNPNGFSHVNGRVQWRLSSATNGLIGPTATYTPFGGSAAISGNTTGIAPSATYGTCNNIYCHSTVQNNLGTGAPTYKSVGWSDAALACSGCHGNDAATLTTGSHATHLSTTTHAAITCANCHSGYETATPPNHVNYVINVQQSAILSSTGTYTDSAGAPGNGYGTCGTSYCHSNVQSATGGARVAGDYKTVTWGSGAMTCASCHGNTDATLVTGTHAKHLNATYGYTCAACHGTAGGAGNTAIHVNQTINIDLTTKGASATYSGDGTPANSNFGTCSVTICHGSNSGAWGTSVSTQLCTECHGQPNTAYANFSSSIIAPGGAGVDTGGNSAATSARVGAHQTHLLASSGISDKVHCGECHTVHVAINEGTHLNYTTSTISFGPTAKAQSHTTAAVTRVSGYINCSATYCHTAKTNTGSGMTPVWNDTNYLTATTNLVMADCKKCHNMPPANTDHTGIANLTSFPAATCNCHTTMSGSATTVAAIFSDKTKHVNGIVDASVDCLGCHKGTQGVRQAVVGATSGSTGDDFVRPSRHIKNTTVKNVDCIICHAEGATTSTETSVARVTEHTNGTVKLRNVDSQANPGTAGTNFWNWPGRRNGGTTITSTDRDNMDRFCVNCHDSDGALTIAVNSAGTGIDTGASVTRRLTPFNPLDGGTPLDVKSQFNSGNAVGKNYASHHNLNIYTKRYTATYATTYSTRGGWTGTSKDGVAMTWDTGLHCSDCHLNESNAHGARLATRMLQDKNGADAAATNSGTGTGTFVCYRCHLSTVYASSVSVTGKARIEHDTLDSVPFTAGSYADRGIVCLNCHSGGAVGGIHGNNRSITTPNQGTTKAYRFMYGNELGLNISEANWETQVQPSCYTSGTTWGGACTKHNGATAETGRIGAPAYLRPLQ